MLRHPRKPSSAVLMRDLDRLPLCYDLKVCITSAGTVCQYQRGLGSSRAQYRCERLGSAPSQPLLTGAGQRVAQTWRSIAGSSQLGVPFKHNFYSPNRRAHLHNEAPHPPCTVAIVIMKGDKRCKNEEKGFLSPVPKAVLPFSYSFPLAAVS